jgi:hypothetical protein
VEEHYLHWYDSSDLTAARILERASDLVAFGWAQGADARDAFGAPVHPWSSSACRWSLLGALVAALDAPALVPEEDLPLSDLAVALGALAELIAEPSLADWNDSAERSRSEVLRTLELARRRLSQPQPNLN